MMVEQLPSAEVDPESDAQAVPSRLRRSPDTQEHVRQRAGLDEPLGLHVPSSSRRRWLLLALGAALLLAMTASTWWAAHRAAPARFLTVTVDRGPVTRTVTATGTVNPELTIIVGSYVSGVIQSVYCDYNTRVKRGQLCAKIDPRSYQAALEQA